MINKIRDLLPSEEVQQKFDLTEKEWLFIVGCYHPKSPLSNIDNTIKKKFDLCTLLGMTKEEADPYILGKDEKTNIYAIKYLRLSHSTDFAELNIYKDQFYQSLENLKRLDETSSNDPESKKKLEDTRKQLMGNINTLKTRIDELTQKFLSNDNSRSILSQLYEELDEDCIVISPEDIAKRISQGKSPLALFNPYL